MALLEREVSGKASGCAPHCCRRKSRCSNFRRSAGCSPTRSRSRPATTIQSAFRPGCSRRAMDISRSPLPAPALRSALPGAWRRAAAEKSGLRRRRRPRQESQSRCTPRLRDHAQPHEWRMDRYPQQSRGAVRADLQDERGLRRSAGAPSRHGSQVHHAQLGDIEVVDQPIELCRTPSQSARQRRRKANIPTKCCANWGIATKR